VDRARGSGRSHDVHNEKVDTDYVKLFLLFLAVNDCCMTRISILWNTNACNGMPTVSSGVFGREYNVHQACTYDSAKCTVVIMISNVYFRQK